MYFRDISYNIVLFLLSNLPKVLMTYNFHSNYLLMVLLNCHQYYYECTPKPIVAYNKLHELHLHLLEYHIHNSLYIQSKSFLLFFHIVANYSYNEL